MVAEHHALGRLTLTGSREPELLFCENESDAARLWNAPPTTPYPKDGIARHVISREATVNPGQTGTKAALHYRLAVAAGETVELQLRLRPDAEGPAPSWPFVVAARHAEADEFYATLTPAGASAEEADVMRQAFSGMLWSKQFFNYDVERWLEGATPQARRRPRSASGAGTPSGGT